MTPEVIEEEISEVVSADSLSEEQLIGSQQYVADAVSDYLKSCESMTVEQWLPQYIKKQNDNISDEEAEKESDEIIQSLREIETAKQSLQAATEKGMSREHWLGKRIEETASHMSEQESEEYLRNLDSAVKEVNVQMYDTLIAENDSVKQNPDEEEIIVYEDSVSGMTVTDKKYLSHGIAENICTTAVCGVAAEPHTNLLEKIKFGEEITVTDIAKAGGKAAFDFGVETAAVVGLRASAEFGPLSVLKGQPSGVFTSIAFIGIENAKTAAKVSRGEISAQEGFEMVQDTTVSAVGGIVASKIAEKSVKALTSKVGAVIGSAFGPVGTVIGAAVGKVTGIVVGASVYTFGLKMGEAISRGMRALRTSASGFFRRRSTMISSGRRRLFERFF